MNSEIQEYHDRQSHADQLICDRLAELIEGTLLQAEGKLWHGHPVWFLEDNPIVGYSSQKAGIRLMFWSGADFGEEALHVKGKKFRDASVFYREVDDIDEDDLKRWLGKSTEIQWDYKNIVKRKGKLQRLK